MNCGLHLLVLSFYEIKIYWVILNVLNNYYRCVLKCYVRSRSGIKHYFGLSKTLSIHPLFKLKVELTGNFVDLYL